MADTTAPAPNTVTWFQIGTEDPAAAGEFYGGLFGWSLAPDPATEDYQLISYRGAERASGGIMRTAGGAENHATVFCITPECPKKTARNPVSSNRASHWNDKNSWPARENEIVPTA